MTCSCSKTTRTDARRNIERSWNAKLANAAAKALKLTQMIERSKLKLAPYIKQARQAAILLSAYHAKQGAHERAIATERADARVNAVATQVQQSAARNLARAAAAHELANAQTQVPPSTAVAVLNVRDFFDDEAIESDGEGGDVPRDRD